MNLISQTFEYDGTLVKLEGKDIYVMGFGTTHYDQKMKHRWIKIELDDFKQNSNLRKQIEKRL